VSAERNIQNECNATSANKIKVTVFLLSCDRSNLITTAIDSILAQSFLDFELIVSDNSAHDDVELLLKQFYPEVCYVRRRPQIAALAHFRLILSEVNTEYFVLFHDDDLLLPNYLECALEYFNLDSEASAVGCNAAILKDDTETGKKIFPVEVKDNIYIESSEQLATHYLFLDGYAAPFPSYMYRTEKIRDLSLNYQEGGKYSDVAFLMKVAQRGPIIWLSEPLMKYRFHSGNDSSSESIGQKLRLLRFVCSNTGIARRGELVNKFRFMYWQRWLRRDRTGSAKKQLVIVRFVLGEALNVLFKQPRVLFRLIARRLVAKC
jgi:glycosyltransferase involved in cell wall biosynthesis